MKEAPLLELRDDEQEVYKSSQRYQKRALASKKLLLDEQSSESEDEKP